MSEDGRLRGGRDVGSNVSNVDGEISLSIEGSVRRPLNVSFCILSMVSCCYLLLLVFIVSFITIDVLTVISNL
jgi:hypothetical protein